MTNKSLYERYPNLAQLYWRFEPGIVQLDRAVTPVWYLLGLFGNSLSAYVWLQPAVRRNNSSAVYLAALSVWDLVFLAFHSVQELQEAWNVSADNVATCSLMPVVLLTAQYLSPVLVLCFTVERWISICFPFRRDSLCNPRRACGVVACTTATVTLWNLWQIYFKQFVDGACHTQTKGWFVYTLTTEVLISGLVPATALVFNLLVIRELRRIAADSKCRAPSGQTPDASVERRFRSTTVMLLCVSFFVILTSLPAGLVYGLQVRAGFGRENITDAEVAQDPQWQRHFAMARAKKVIDEVSISHYSLNFIIYLATGPQYRRQAAGLLSLIVKKLRHCCRCCGEGVGVGGDPASDDVGRRRRRRQQQQRQVEKELMHNTSTDRARRARRIDNEAANQSAASGDGASAADPLVTSVV